ncbi:MAG TPA: GIY-YIG nuclease family protein [Candidatus Paceibacterota bacterium]|nr:GIY-YIG nuclease family protein [Candidatus Paceibacterota bacterium]HOK17141.1 GIY-YIG nuclease family protein [Candidatus Paceibacterota bacterium]HPP64563.1 GIY-YIG nuclease family protein [Candidatus Paceibacterota bacterium]
MFYVYILQSLKDRKLYIGYSTDLRKRLKDHNSGGTKSTKIRRPFKLIYYEAHLSEKEARRREKYFKTAKGKSTLRQMLRESLS